MRPLAVLVAVFVLAFAQPVGAQTNCISAHDQLFGPLPGTGNGYTFTPPNSFTTLTALTASSKDYWWHRGPPPAIDRAQFMVVWYPHPGAEARLSHRTSQGVETPLCTVTAPTVVSGPIASQCDVTAALQAYADDGAWFSLIASYRGNGADSAILYETRLTIVYCLGA